MKSNLWILLAVFTCIVCCGRTVFAEDVPGLDWKEPPPVPFMSVPPSAKAPAINRGFKTEDWDDACAINGLAQWGGASILYPQTRVYITYDTDNAYIAFICTKGKAEWWKAPNRFRDSEVYLNNPYIEFFFSPDDPGNALVAYQFCINAYGAVYDCRNMPAFGLKEIGYNNRLDIKVEESATEIQFNIRIAARDLDPRGFQPGQKWLTNFCRSWPQMGWSNRSGQFIDRPAMGQLVLDTKAPALQWLKLYDVLEGKLEVQTAIKNTGLKKRSFVLSAVVTGENTGDLPAEAAETVTLDPGERKEIQLSSDKTFAGKRGHLELSCTGDAGKTLYYRQYLRFNEKQTGGAAKLADALKAEAPISKEISVNARYGQM
ncbi:MAG: hypothetical protein HQL31_13190, partial [Planctomycetes bacterium]|nr:hypothetical protein [Planctomycetota bacterium]